MPPKRARKPTAKAAAAKKASSRPSYMLDWNFDIPSPPARPMTPPPSAQPAAPQTALQTALQTAPIEDSQATQTPTQLQAFMGSPLGELASSESDLNPISSPPVAPARPPDYRIEWSAFAGKLRIANDNVRRAEFNVDNYISHAVLEAKRQVKKQKVDTTGLVARATFIRKGGNSIQDLRNKADLKKIDDELQLHNKPDMTVKIWIDLPVEEEEAHERDEDSNWAGNEVIPSTQPAAAVSTASTTATSQQRAQLPGRLQAERDSGVSSTALIASSNRCSRKDCPHSGKPCYLTEGVHVPLSADLLRKWASRFDSGTATITDPGAALIEPFVKQEVEDAAKRDARKRGTKRTADSPQKGRSTMRNGPLIQNFHLTPQGPQLMGSPGWPQPFQYGHSPLFPSWPGFPQPQTSGAIERHSSPPTIDGEDDDEFLQAYFAWLKLQRPSKTSQFQAILEELEGHSYGYGQLTKVPTEVWDEIDAPAGLKDSVLTQRRSFQKYQRRTAEAQRAQRDEMISLR